MNIFQISEEYLKLMNDLEESEGVLTEELEERLRVNSNNIYEKLKAYRYIKLMLESDVNMISDEINRLSNIKKSKTLAIERIKDVMLTSTLIFGDTGKTGNKKLDYPDFKLYTVNKKVVSIEDELSFTNPNYVRYSVSEVLTKEELDKVSTIKPDITADKLLLKKEILSDLTEGVEIEGAAVVIKPYINIR